MQQPQLNMEDSLHPGKGPRGRPDLGAVWNDERKSRVFNHTLPLNRTLSALTHDIPVHAWNRRLTPSEAGMLQGFRGDYNWQPAIDAGRYRPNLSKPKSQSVVGTMIGNAVSPFVSRAIARGLMKKSASNQLTLSQWY
jgi:site-specific DNA-cytosine methylase